MIRTLSIGLLAQAVLSGCVSYGSINNLSNLTKKPSSSYSMRDIVSTNKRSNEVTFVLSFSGGGMRAAALAYGVMKELRDTNVRIRGKSKSLLTEVDMITSVSGGSFTAAYFGLYGDAMFNDYEKVFLRRDVESELISGLFNPTFWFSKYGRTDMAINFYDENVFKGATFADLKSKDGPLIVINASDLGSGVRFSFLQEYFNLLCSDLSSFPVSRAVAASSAVPILFNPVVLKNHSGCNTDKYQWPYKAQQHVNNSPQLKQVMEGLLSYQKKNKRKYIHLVDGGVTDNLGLRAIYEIVEVSGGVKPFLKSINNKPSKRFVLISVNASTIPESDMEESAKAPTLEQTVNAVSDIQLHRYNASTYEEMQNSVKRWSAELSTPSSRVKSYFVKVDLKNIAKLEKYHFLQQIPTNLSLNNQQVDSLISAGRELLRNNTEFQRFIKENIR